MTGHLTRILATSALSTTLVGGLAPSSQALTLPVTSAREIAGSAPTEPVRWWGGWGGYGWGWRRPYYGGGAVAAGLIGGLALGALAASTSSYYGYAYPSYGYGYYPSSSYYAYPSYSYGYYPSYYAYGTSYGYYPSYSGGGYWLSGKPVHKRKSARHGR